MNGWLRISEAFESKTPRERIIVSLLVLAVIWMLFNFLFLMPIDKTRDTFNQRLKSAEQELKKLSAQELVLAQALTNDPNATKKKEIVRLENRLKDLDKSLQALAVGLISADELPQALHEVLQSIGSLKLIGMETLAPSKLRLETEVQDEPEVLPEPEGDDQELVSAELLQDQNDNKTNEVGVFKHSVVVALEGRYFDVISYLKALEDLQWKIYWEGIDYQVTQYPRARVLIEVYTLSTEAGVLGV